MTTLETLIRFLKGFVPGYSALEHLIAPVFGSDVDDYGQCRANCSDPASWPAVTVACNKCIDKIATDAILKLLPELAGAGAAGLALKNAGTVIKDYITEWLEKKGLTALAGRAVPILGWIFIIGDIANIVATLIMAKKVIDAANAAKKKFCVCP